MRGFSKDGEDEVREREGEEEHDEIKGEGRKSVKVLAGKGV